VLIAKTELAKLDAEIEKEMSRIMKAAKTTYEAEKAQIGLIEKEIVGLKNGYLEFSQHKSHLEDLEREISASKDLYGQLLRRYKETQAQEKLHTADARLVASAHPPQRPSHPK